MNFRRRRSNRHGRPRRILSCPGQPSYAHAFRWASDLAKFYQDWGPDLCESRWRAHSLIGVSFECPYQHPRPGQRDKVPSVPVSGGWFESCSCWFLESASEVKQRENDEKLKSLVHYIVLCEKQNILLRGHPNEKVNQATVSRLSSASDGPGIVLVDKEAGSPGNSIALLSFKPKLMMLLYWGIFIAILIREENKSSIFHPRSRMSWLTAEEKP